MQALEKPNFKHRRRGVKPTCSKVNQRIIASRAAGQKAGWELVPTDSTPVTNSELKPDNVASGRSVRGWLQFLMFSVKYDTNLDTMYCSWQMYVWLQVRGFDP